jgi:hypothetical protein
MISLTQLLVVVASMSAGVRAQQPTPATPDDNKREFTVTGCLLSSGYAGFQIDDAKLDAIDGKPAPSTSADARSGAPKKWILDGGGNLRPHTGEKVQVVGRSDWEAPAAAARSDEPPNRTPHLEVKSLKTIAASCIASR